MARFSRGCVSASLLNMNEINGPARTHGTTQAADGLPRLKWSLAEFERLSELGFFGGIDRERERVELVDGELLPMPAKGGRHELVRARLVKRLTLALGEEFDVMPQPGWRPGGERYLEPDILVCRAGLHPAEVAPDEVLLLLEVSDTSVAYDSGLKARVYAGLGVAEYWIVNARNLSTTVHRDPAGETYRSVREIAPASALIALRLPGISLSLGSLGID